MHATPDDEHADGETHAVGITNEEWCRWLQEDVRACSAYATHGDILDECCAVAASWRERFWDRKQLWSRIRHGRRLAKELHEIAPVIRAVRMALASMTDANQQKVAIIDLCSGFGYLGMFLSELLPRDRVDRIVLVDLMWAPQNVERLPHHLNPEHVLAPGWPIRLTTSRANLKVPSDRRSLAKAFLSHGAPAMLLGVHLCGTLSLRAIELYNDCPGFGLVALEPRRPTYGPSLAYTQA